MSFVDLDRRFIPWSEKKAPDAGIAYSWGISAGPLGWQEILKWPRVILLAEAGSGKTEEMLAQSKRQNDAGKPAFYAAVHELGSKDLSDILLGREKKRYAEWRAGASEARFFIDSVDEAKARGVDMRRVFARLADGIGGAERRASIILSSRLTDWEFRRDYESFVGALAAPEQSTGLEPPDPNSVLLQSLGFAEKPKVDKAETPLLILMAALDEERVRRYAQAKSILDVQTFLDAIGANDLWHFARRPLDLDWLVQFWTAHNRMGTLSEMLGHSLCFRLQEKNPSRARQDGLDGARAFAALDRVGAALVFARRAAVSLPDTEQSFTPDETAFDFKDIVPDWSPQDRAWLLTRPVFDPESYGKVLLHNDNEGIVRGYLTASWLSRLEDENLPQSVLRSLLFSSTYGVDTIRPSLREAIAWLALKQEDVAKEVLRRDPELLMTAGDPASLPPRLRADLLASVVARLLNDEIGLHLINFDSVKRFAKRDLEPLVRHLWTNHSGHHSVRELLLRIIWLGRFMECHDLAAAAIHTHESAASDEARYLDILAGRAYLATADAAGRLEYAAFIKTRAAIASPSVIWDALEELFPYEITVGLPCHPDHHQSK